MDQRLSELVEDLTTSGEPQLNPEKMKELKKICKASEEQLSHAYRLLMSQLSQEHAEIRLSAFQIVDQLFARSHQFRLLVISDLQEFLELTLGTDHKRPLPPPREVAQRLRQATTRAIQAWHERFGAAYKKLALGHHFLRHTQQVDFQDVNVRTPAERKREEERQKRLDRIYRERAEQAVQELEEMSEEIRGCLMEVESCFRLLVPFDLGPSLGPVSPTVASGASEEGAPCLAGVPSLKDEEQPCCSKDLPASAWRPAAIDGQGLSQAAPGSPSEEDEDSDQGEFVRCHGLGSHKYTLGVELSSDSLRVQEDEDNCAIVQSARDALKLLRNKYLPAVCTWVQLFTRAGLHGGHLEATINLKAELESALRRCGELGIKPEGARRQEIWGVSPQTAALGDPHEDNEEDDDGFVEVPEKEGYEACVPDHLWPQDGLQRDPAAQGVRARTRTDEEACDPTSTAAQLQWLQSHFPPCPRAPLEAEEAGKLAAERARAPVVPFGVDLCYWGQEQPTGGRVLKSESQHRFWKPSEVDMELDGAHVSQVPPTRLITFAGTFEPVQHQCRAPMPDGRLCKRQDRLKCPFHGKIIPRDDAGRPLHPEDRAREQRQQLQKQAERPDWQDPEFMRDVEMATGVDLGSSRVGRKGRGKRRQHPGLTDLKQRADTTRTRLAKKVFAKAAMQRVVTAMNQMDQKKHEKFANQFNYALN